MNGSQYSILNDSLKKPTPRSKLRGIYGFLPFGTGRRPTRCFLGTLQRAAGNDQVQRRAIHEIACTNYSPEVLNSWGSPLNRDLLSKEVADFETKAEQGIFTVVAEVDGILAGFGEVVPKQNLLLAIYINPDFKRQGVGTKILSELERITKKEGADFLRMDSSLTAEHFYVSCGYKVIERGFHILSSGERMACIRMKKNLA